MTNHQANYARILRLKETTDGLNQHITSILTLLANSRKELLATPTTSFPDNQRNVPYTELLNYAKRISRFTVPPTFRHPAPAEAHLHQPANTEAANSVSNAVAQGSTSTPTDGEGKGQGIGVSSLGQNEVEWLDPLNQIPFVPWPSEEVIKRGALAQIQVMLEQGIDPASVDASGDTSTTEMDSTTMSQDVTKDEGTSTRQDTIIAPASRPSQTRRSTEKPRVFGGLELYNPDEED